MKTVSMILNKDGRPVSVWLDAKEAKVKVDRWNTDPFVSPGLSDPGAPYTVETWVVSEVRS